MIDLAAMRFSSRTFLESRGVEIATAYFTWRVDAATCAKACAIQVFCCHPANGSGQDACWESNSHCDATLELGQASLECLADDGDHSSSWDMETTFWIQTTLPPHTHLFFLQKRTVYGGVYAIGDVAFCVGFAVGPALSGTLVKNFGFQKMLIGVAFICFLYCPLLTLLKDPPSKSDQEKAEQEVSFF